MKLFRLLLAASLLSVVLVAFSTAKPEYSKKEGNMKCTECHEGGNPKKLTAKGQYYKEHNHSLEGYKK